MHFKYFLLHVYVHTLTHTHKTYTPHTLRCVSQWQCLYWALAGYWHQVSGDLCGSRLAGISLDCIKVELHDTVATRVLYLLAPASQQHTHRNTPPGTLWVTLTQMSLCQCCPNSSDKMERIREREGQMSGRKQERGRNCSSGCLKCILRSLIKAQGCVGLLTENSVWTCRWINW